MESLHAGFGAHWHHELGNVLPALSVSLLGLALAFRDGLAAMLAWVAALLAAAYAAALALGAASLLTQLLQAPV